MIFRTQHIPALVFLYLITWPAHAQNTDNTISSAGDLAVLCNSQYDTDYGYCAGYITAVAEIIRTNSIDGYKACNTGQTRSQQFVDIVKTFIVKNPDLRTYSAREVVARALARAFPCFDTE